MAINRLQFGGLLNPRESFGWEEYGQPGPQITTPSLLGAGVFGDVAGKKLRTQRGLSCPTGTQPNASNTACVPIQKTKVCPDGSLPPCGPTTQRCADGSLPPCGPTTQRCADGSLPPCGPKDKGLCTSGPRAGQRPHPVYGCSDTRQCQYGTYADGRCKPKPLGPDKPGVGITVDGEVVQAPAGHYMPGHVGDPSYYMGADPNWAGGIDYPVTGYTPELIAEQTRMAGLLEGVGQPTDWRNILGGPLSYMDKSTGFDIGEIGPTTRLPTAPLSTEDFLAQYSRPSKTVEQGILGPDQEGAEARRIAEMQSEVYGMDNLLTPSPRARVTAGPTAAEIRNEASAQQGREQSQRMSEARDRLDDIKDSQAAEKASNKANEKSRAAQQKAEEAKGAAARANTAASKAKAQKAVNEAHKAMMAATTAGVKSIKAKAKVSGGYQPSFKYTAGGGYTGGF